MKSVVVYFFSGTGNTKKIADMVKTEFEIHDYHLSLISMEDRIHSTGVINENDFDLIGLAYPIYGFGTPDIVDDFVKLLPAGKGKKIFLFKTGADFISINHNASALLIRELESKGYSVFYDRIIVMNSNWIVSYNDSMVRQLYKSAEEKVRHMVKEILKSKTRRYHTGYLMKSLSLGISRLEKKYGSKYYGKSLRTDRNCNSCQICSKNCPQGNISYENGKISFAGNCIWCMRCAYNCPQKAIYSRGMNFCILKDGYNLDKILEDDQPENAFLTKDTKGFFKHLYRYISDIKI